MTNEIPFKTNHWRTSVEYREKVKDGEFITRLENVYEGPIDTTHTFAENVMAMAAIQMRNALMVEIHKNG